MRHYPMKIEVDWTGCVPSVDNAAWGRLGIVDFVILACSVGAAGAAGVEQGRISR